MHAFDRARHPVVGLHRHVSPRWQHAAMIACAALAGAVGYVAAFGAYGLTAGSSEYLAGRPDHAACDNPAARFGWTYEAVNYDRDDDARLLGYTPDPSWCGSQGEEAGGLIRSADRTPLAAWYIPAAAWPDPTGPTIVLVHGGKSNKSGMLEYAPAFHARYNLVIPDLRNSGRSGGDESTGGVDERDDVRAMIDWLMAEKKPSWVAVMGNSNGGAAVLAEAVDDPRVSALILDSMHATVDRQLTRIIEWERHLPAWPAVPALIAGVSIRIDDDLRSVDPLRTIALVGERPVLLTHGAADEIDRPADSVELNVAAALAARVNVRAEICDGAGHGRVVEVCGAAWTGWVTGFLVANLGG
jgi:pimeloyl-ACP methyl ester carboxylesterase